MSATLARCKCHVEFFKTLPESSSGGGTHTYGRAFRRMQSSVRQLLYGGEEYYLMAMVHPIL